MSGELSDDDRDERGEILKRHVAMLMEHFECVQILASNSGADSTTCYHWGGGNMMARIAGAREFVIKKDEQARVEARRDANCPGED